MHAVLYHAALMSEGLPVRVDVERLAARDARIHSVTPVASMKRLVELLTDAEGSVESELRFSHGSGRRRIDGAARTQVRVACQRCLEPMTVGIDADIQLVVVADEAEIQTLPDEAEAVVSDDGTVSPLELVEDELILALPIVPMHEEAECSVRVADHETPAERSNPFDVLKQLKNRQH